MSRFVLGYPSFRWLWTSSLCAYAAMWIQQASIAWLVYDHTGSAALVGAVAGVRMIPLLAFAPLSGVAADRYDRRKLLQSSAWLAAGTVILFGGALVAGRLSTWMLFAFSLLSSSANVLDRPARHSTVFELVPRERVPQAITLNIMGNSSMRVLGPALAGYLIAWFGIAGNFFIQGALYLSSGMLAFLVAFPVRKAAAHRESALSDMVQGLRYCVTDPTTRLLITIAGVQYFVLVPTFGVLFPVYAKDVFQAGPEGLGLMLTMIGAGGVTGAFVAGQLMRLDRIGWIQAGALGVFSAALLGLAASPTIHVALFACVIAGAAEMLVSTNNQTVLQMSAPPEMRGRVVSIIQLNPALIALGSFLIGPLGDLLGARGASAAAALACLSLVAVLLARTRRLRELRLSHYRQVRRVQG